MDKSVRLARAKGLKELGRLFTDAAMHQMQNQPSRPVSHRCDLPAWTRKVDDTGCLAGQEIDIQSMYQCHALMLASATVGCKYIVVTSSGKHGRNGFPGNCNPELLAQVAIKAPCCHICGLLLIAFTRSIVATLCLCLST